MTASRASEAGRQKHETPIFVGPLVVIPQAHSMQRPTERRSRDMYYALLIHAAENEPPPLTPDEHAAVMPTMDRFDADLTAAGQNLGSLRLGPATAAAVIRVRGGRVIAPDGPFAETKEVLGGIYIVRADDDDEARAIAARLPTTAFAVVEVRRIAGVDLRGAVLDTPGQ